MQKSLRSAACSCVLVLLSASMTGAQELTGTVTGSVILDDTASMFNHEQSNLITSGEALTQRNLQMMMGPGGGASGAPPAAEMARDAALLGDKTRELDRLPQASSAVPRDLARRLAGGDATKRARLAKLFGGLLVKYRSQVPAKFQSTVSGSYDMLLMTAYGLQIGDAAQTLRAFAGADPSLGSSTAVYVAARQLANGRPASDAEKQRMYDTVAIVAEVLDTVGDLADKRSDAPLKAKVRAQAAGTIKQLFGCSTQTTPPAACVKHISDVATTYAIKNRDTFLKL